MQRVNAVRDSRSPTGRLHRAISSSTSSACSFMRTLSAPSKAAVWASTEAVQIFGGYGYTKDFPVEKFYRDSKLCTIGEGTSEIQKLVISRNVLKG